MKNNKFGFCTKDGSIITGRNFEDCYKLKKDLVAKDDKSEVSQIAYRHTNKELIDFLKDEVSRCK